MFVQSAVFARTQNQVNRSFWYVRLLDTVSVMIANSCLEGVSTCMCCLCYFCHRHLTERFVYSFKWVESPQHGQGGPDWVEVSFSQTKLWSHTY